MSSTNPAERPERLSETWTLSQTPDTYYAATRNLAFTGAPLTEALTVDVCVIGGGFTGVNTAIELAERGLQVALLEAHTLGWGASGRNGGQLIRGVGHHLPRFRNLLGADGVRQLQQIGLQAVDIVRQRIETHAIDCDLTWGYCDLANRAKDLAELAAEADELRELGYRPTLELVPAADLHNVVGSSRYAGGLIDRGSGHLHPLNLLLGEAQVAQRLGVRIFEHSAVLRIEHGASVRVHTAQGQIRANTLVLACNAYLGDLHKPLSAKVLPAGSYVIATEPLPVELAQRLLPQNMAVCDRQLAVDYFRLSADRRLLFGAACHYSGRDPRDIAAYLQPKMLKVFPMLKGVRIDFQWAGMLGIGANRLPQIGRLASQPNVFYAQAYAGHGLNATHLAARLLGEAISGQQSDGFELFASVAHASFPGGRYLRSPLLALGMLWHRLKNLR